MSKSQRNTKPTEGELHSRVRGEAVTATAVFANIPHLKDWDDRTVFRAIGGLHQSVRSHFGREVGGRLSVLSSLTGAILIVPDQSNLYVHQHLNRLGSLWSQMGIPVAVGIAHGELEILSDVDRMLNAVGQPLNIAARLAFHGNRPGCILHSSYLEFSAAVPDDRSFFRHGRSVSITGKAHDREVLRGIKASSAAFPNVGSVSAAQLPRLRRDPKTTNAVAIGYDLPRFSAGDRSELSKRFRAIADVFDALRAEGLLKSSSALYFSPGGDGGVVVLETSKRYGYQVAERMATKLSVESQGRDSQIQVLTRIGIHYGPVTLYQNASGVLRPTGRTCFIADAVASDQAPVDVRTSSVVLTDVFRDIVGEGSEQFFASAFEELSPLPKGLAKGFKRFIKRKEKLPKPEDALLKELADRPASWEPVD